MQKTLLSKQPVSQILNTSPISQPEVLLLPTGVNIAPWHVKATLPQGHTGRLPGASTSHPSLWVLLSRTWHKPSPVSTPAPQLDTRSQEANKSNKSLVETNQTNHGANKILNSNNQYTQRIIMKNFNKHKHKINKASIIIYKVDYIQNYIQHIIKRQKSNLWKELRKRSLNSETRQNKNLQTNEWQTASSVDARARPRYSSQPPKIYRLKYR